MYVSQVKNYTIWKLQVFADIYYVAFKMHSEPYRASWLNRPCDGRDRQGRGIRQTPAKTKVQHECIDVLMLSHVYSRGSRTVTDNT